MQDRMLQTGRELWSWIADGAHIYVCGDAQRMAKDVERALVDIPRRTARVDQRSGRISSPSSRRPAAIRRTCTDPMHAPVALPPRPHHLPLLRRGLRRAGDAGRTGGAIIAGDPDHPANFGRLCSKGAALGETLGLERPAAASDAAAAPTARCARRLGQRARPVADGFRRIIERDGPDAVAFYLSGPAADRGLLRRQQAGEGLHRHRQRRHQLAAVHGLGGRGPQPRVRRGHGAAAATRTSTRPT